MKSAPEIGMVFQGFNLFPHLTALENVMLGPTHVLKLQPALEAEPLALSGCFRKVGLDHKAADHPGEGCPAGSSSALRSLGRWPCSPG